MPQIAPWRIMLIASILQAWSAMPEFGDVNSSRFRFDASARVIIVIS
jgi:hypothetical protein